MNNLNEHLEQYLKDLMYLSNNNPEKARQLAIEGLISSGLI